MSYKKIDLDFLKGFAKAVLDSSTEEGLAEYKKKLVLLVKEFRRVFKIDDVAYDIIDQIIDSAFSFADKIPADTEEEWLANRYNQLASDLAEYLDLVK